MYIVAFLIIKPQKKVVIPIQWCQSIDLAQVFNVGVNKTKLHKVFYCEGIDTDPNFRLPVEEIYVDRPACYNAKLKYAFNTIEAAKNHLVKARSVLPVVYNENKTRYDWHAPELDEQSCNQTVHVKLEHEVDRLQNQLTQLQEQMAVVDLDPNELRDLQATVMDVDDEIDFAFVMPLPVKEEPVTNIPEFDELDYAPPNGNNQNESTPGNDDDNSNDVDSQTNTQSIIQTSISPVFVTNNNGGSSTQCCSNENSILDSVAGYMNYNIDGKGDRYFPCVDVSISNAIYGLMQFYNEQQKLRPNGELFDLKYVNLLMKGIFGTAKMAEMDPELVDFDDPKMQFAKDLFGVRVDSDENRLIFFEEHVSKCIESTKQALFMSQFKR